MPNQHDSRSRSDCPCSRKGKEGERVRGVGASSFCLSLELTTPDSSSFSPLHSVLSSRCQEVAQCLFFFSFERLHDFTRLFFFFFFLYALQSWRSRLVVKEFQVGLCVCVSSCLQSLGSLSLEAVVLRGQWSQRLLVLEELFMIE